jgi:hypothetical protein
MGTPPEPEYYPDRVWDGTKWVPRAPHAAYAGVDRRLARRRGEALVGILFGLGAAIAGFVIYQQNQPANEVCNALNSLVSIVPPPERIARTPASG